MRIKRLLSLALCLAILCLTLVGCAEDKIGAYLDIYNYEPEQVVNMEFDFYIIVGDDTGTAAMTTVKDKINQYLGDKYNTKLNIYFTTADKYESVVNAAVTESAVTDVTLKLEDANDDKIVDPLRVNAGKIVLVTGEAMMSGMIESGKLYDLAPFLNTNAFGTLNTSIPEVLLEAAKTAEGELFCIPNNHVIGEYEYVCINRVEALKYNFSDRTELRQIVSDEDIAALEAIIGEDNVEIVKGPYELREQKEESGWICNIREYPEATAAEAYSSAFAIIPETVVYFDANGDGKIDEADHKDYDRDGKISDGKEKGCLADKNEVARRAMEVVYSINADATLRNYLQYGIEGINYSMDYSIDEVNGMVVYANGEDTRYHMPLLYTGDVFKAKFILEDYEGNSWTSEMKVNGTYQNKDAK